jgi:hypothetical protein
MTTATNESKPKRNYTKMAFLAIGLVLSILGVDKLTFNAIPIGASVTVSDTKVIISAIDNLEQRLIAVGDSTSVKGIHIVGVIGRTSGGEQVISWLGKTVIIKNTSNLNWLINMVPNGGTFIVSAEEGDKIQVNNYTSAWLNRGDFELKP